jgi:colanic acid/amylovoran biosynthesis glycosyltransferase
VNALKTAKPLRIAYLTTHYPGVTHTFITREILALRELGHEVATFAINAESDVLSEVDRAEAAATRYLKGRPILWMIRAIAASLFAHPVATVATLLVAWRRVGLDFDRRGRRMVQVGEALLLERMCRDEGVEHIHAHFGQAPANIAWFAASFASRAGRGRRMTWSATVHGPQDCLNEPPRLLQRKVRAASFIIAVCDFTKAQLLWRLTPDLWDRVHVVRCGINLDVPMNTIGRQGNSPFRALIVARISAEKGHTVALEALAILKQRGHVLQLVLVGPCNEKDPFGDVLDQLGIRDSVTVAGAVPPPQVAAQMGQADALIVPSFAEGLPVVIMEAMAAGLPVIASGIAGIPELVEHDVSGLLVVPARSDILADAIQKLIVNPDLARSLAAAARLRVEQLHDEGINIRSLAEHLEKAARR